METSQQISNPIQAASEVFYRPKAVFTTIGQVNNWSWVPFILVIAMVFLPSYLYYQIVDTNWIIDQIALVSLPDGSPAEIENFKRMVPAESLQYSTFVVPIVLIIVQAILAGYYTFVTRNDDKNVQGFTDWYGATWWIAMPAVINSVVALMILAMQDAGAQISTAYTMPFSLAFILGMEMTDPLFNWLLNIRLDTIWSIILAAYCIQCWTSFSMQKSVILAVIPTAVLLSISLLLA